MDSNYTKVVINNGSCLIWEKVEHKNDFAVIGGSVPRTITIVIILGTSTTTATSTTTTLTILITGLCLICFYRKREESARLRKCVGGEPGTKESFPFPKGKKDIGSKRYVRFSNAL